MMSKIFVDSNIWIYALSTNEAAKKRVALSFIADKEHSGRLVISYQVVNEVSRVLKRKGTDEPMIRDVIRSMTNKHEVVGFSEGLALRASELREAHGFSYWDSHIVAAALSCGADTLASENMSDGQGIGGLRIRNVFA